jgi:hypothetical protein
MKLSELIKDLIDQMKDLGNVDVVYTAEGQWGTVSEVTSGERTTAGVTDEIVVIS